MTKSSVLSIALVCLFGISSCTSTGGAGEKQGEPLWAGMYYGVIPAADCPGIAVVAIFNTSGFYKITYQYIDRDVPVVTFSGNFTWDEKAKTISPDGSDLPSYKLKGDKLIQLDMKGKEITGRLARNYILRKVMFP
jgi:uncharacterized lipoprotein NlpE involved in copper resistance